MDEEEMTMMGQSKRFRRPSTPVVAASAPTMSQTAFGNTKPKSDAQKKLEADKLAQMLRSR